MKINDFFGVNIKSQLVRSIVEITFVVFLILAAYLLLSKLSDPFSYPQTYIDKFLWKYGESVCKFDRFVKKYDKDGLWEGWLPYEGCDFLLIRTFIVNVLKY